MSKNDEMNDPNHANDSAPKRGHGAHGRGRGDEEKLDPAVSQPDSAKGTERGSAGWGSESSGGSTFDKRPPKNPRPPGRKA